jgi:CheY-like chemotaxis protein
MDTTHSGLPPVDLTSDAALLSAFGKVRLAIKDNPQAQEAVKTVLTILTQFFHVPDRTPPQMHTVVDNLSPESLGIDTGIPNDVHHLVSDEPDDGGCLASTVVDAPVQADLPRLSLMAPMVSPTPMNGRNKSALVIESDRSLSRMFTAFLKSDHYLVRTTNTGEDALRLYRDCAPFEVVIIDYHMPKKDGVDIALDILKDDPTQPMIIVAYDYASEDDVPRRKEVMSIPFLLEMGNSRFRKMLDKLQPWATREEVYSAINALTTAQLLRLKRYGDGLVRFSRGTDYRTGEDLLQQALGLTMEGRVDGGKGRRWNKRITFEKHLYRTIRNLTHRRKSDIEWEVVERDSDGSEVWLLDGIDSGQRSAEERLIAAEEVDQIRGMFKDDPKAMSVLNGWLEGMRRNEVTQEGLTENQYRSAVRRIRMKLLSPTNGAGKEENHDEQD